MTTQEKILLATQREFAQTGIMGLSLRAVAKRAQVATSVIYHYFSNKDDLLEQMYHFSNRELGAQRAGLPRLQHFDDMLKQRIAFQLHHAESIVAVLKYYLHKRSEFPKQEHGFLPEKTYLHIEEILSQAIDSGYFSPTLPIRSESRVIVHAINGFLLEYFPARLSQQEESDLISTISTFILRSLHVYRVTAV